MIITENEKSLVVFSSLLQRHYPKLEAELVDIIFSYHKGLGAVFHTKDYWVRDFIFKQVRLERKCSLSITKEHVSMV